MKLKRVLFVKLVQIEKCLVNFGNTLQLKHRLLKDKKLYIFFRVDAALNKFTESDLDNSVLILHVEYSSFIFQ